MITESEFESVEKALNLTSKIILEYNRNKDYYLTQVVDLVDYDTVLQKTLGKGLGTFAQNKLENLGALAGSIYKKLGS